MLDDFFWELPKCPRCGETPRVIIREANEPTRYEPCGHSSFLSDLEVTDVSK